MHRIAAAFVAIGVAGGVAVGVGQYQAATPDRPAPVSAPVALPTARPTVVKVQVEPCEAGWKLTRGTCVRVVEKRVFAAPPATGTPERAVRSTRTTRPPKTVAAAHTPDHGSTKSGTDDSQVADDVSDHSEPTDDDSTDDSEDAEHESDD